MRLEWNWIREHVVFSTSDPEWFHICDGLLCTQQLSGPVAECVADLIALTKRKERFVVLAMQGVESGRWRWEGSRVNRRAGWDANNARGCSAREITAQLRS
jgi:hypothetical protein